MENESILGAFQTVRDQMIFTDKRFIAVNVTGITGKRKEYWTLPYSNIQYFVAVTPGFLELVSDSELALFFNNGLKAEFEFRGNVNILALTKAISEYVLLK